MKIRLCVLACLFISAACDRSQAPSSASAPRAIRVSLSTGKLVAPDTVEAGWARLRVEEDGAGHILVAFRVPDTATDAELASFRGVLDTARMTPPWAQALGGPEVGDTGTVVLDLAPGRYLLGCMSRGADRHRHVSGGEARVLEVIPSSRATAPPAATQEVKMVDFAYGTDASWQAGEHLIRVENNGQQDHHLRVDRLPPGATLQDWLGSQGEVGEPLAGVARTSPGQTVYLPVNLPPGGYVLYCLVPEAASGTPHAAMGMFRAVTVE